MSPEHREERISRRKGLWRISEAMKRSRRVRNEKKLGFEIRRSLVTLEQTVFSRIIRSGCRLQSLE